jgi:hypothetical protein
MTVLGEVAASLVAARSAALALALADAEQRRQDRRKVRLADLSVAASPSLVTVLAQTANSAGRDAETSRPA